MGKFIIRLDDACPTMRVENWNKIEKILYRYKICPLVALIPDNKDNSLKYEKPDKLFWSKVKRWQKKKWNVGIHGLNHITNTKNSGMMGINNKSEFSRLSYNKQKILLKKSINFFKKKGLKINYWIAPFHSFDKTTLSILRDINSNIIISDGFSFRPFKYLGLKWVPQQLWKFYNIPFGIWTICLHPNTMKLKDFETLKKILKYHNKKFINVENKSLRFNKKNFIDIIFEYVFKILLKIKKNIA